MIYTGSGLKVEKCSKTTEQDHTVATIVQRKTVSVSCLFYYTLNRPELKQWSSGFVGTVTDTVRMPDDQVGLT